MATLFSSSLETTSSDLDMSFPTFRARVPASTSNCGPGFDTLGLAFDLYNEVILRQSDDGKIAYAGNNPYFQEREEAMIEEVARAFFERTGESSFGFSFDIRGEVPLARGLGSSVTVRAGVIGALNAAVGSPLSKQQIVEIVSVLEGHPDNAAAAVLGGFCVARTDPASGCFVDVIRFDLPSDLAFVVVSPDLEIQTRASRQALPESLPFADVVKSLNSLAFLVSVFATGEYSKLRGAVTDFIHQPYRLSGIPGAESSIAAGVAAGAFTGWLSGSGSSILCVAREGDREAVSVAMAGVFARMKIPFHSRLLCCDNIGLQVDRI